MHVTDAQQLALKICQAKTINLSTRTLFTITNFTSQWRLVSFSRIWFRVFSGYPRECKFWC